MNYVLRLLHSPSILSFKQFNILFLLCNLFYIRSGRLKTGTRGRLEMPFGFLVIFPYNLQYP